jgi:hypothetical protein
LNHQRVLLRSEELADLLERKFIIVAESKEFSTFFPEAFEGSPKELKQLGTLQLFLVGIMLGLELDRPISAAIVMIYGHGVSIPFGGLGSPVFIDAGPFSDNANETRERVLGIVCSQGGEKRQKYILYNILAIRVLNSLMPRGDSPNEPDISDIEFIPSCLGSGYALLDQRAVIGVSISPHHPPSASISSQQDSSTFILSNSLRQCPQSPLCRISTSDSISRDSCLKNPFEMPWKM